jgi:hypothetical protein
MWFGQRLFDILKNDDEADLEFRSKLALNPLGSRELPA